MEDELSDAVARFVLEAGGLDQAKAGLKAFTRKQKKLLLSTAESENTTTPSTSIATLSPLLFLTENTDPGAAVPERLSLSVPTCPNVVSPADTEVLDPWRSPGTRQITTESSILLYRGCGTSGWGDEEQSKSASPAAQTPTQPFSPTEVYPQDSDTFNVSAMPPPSMGSIRCPALTPSRSLDQRRPMLMPLAPSPHRHPVSTSDLSPPATTRISSPPCKQQRSPSQRLGQTHSKRVPDQHQAHPLSRELPLLRHRDAQVSHPMSSVQPIPGQLFGERGLDRQLAAITPKDSILSQNQFYSVVSKIEQDKWYLGEMPYIRLTNSGIPVRVLVTAPKPTTIRSKSWYSVSRGRRIGIFYNWNLVQSYTSGHNASFKGWKTEYEAYIHYQECLLRGEVERINLPGDEGEENDGNGENGDNGENDDNGDASDEYFADDLWPI